MNKKVLVVHNSYKIPGGEDAVVENEMELLRGQGYKVLEYRRNNSELDEMRTLSKMKAALSSFFSLHTYRDINELIKKEQIDILHVHNTFFLISPSVYYAARKHHIPIVQTIHNFRLLCPNGLLMRDGHVCEECIEKGLNCAVQHKCYRNSRIQSIWLSFLIWFYRKLRIYNWLNYICLTEFNKQKLLQLNKCKGIHISSEQIWVKPNFVEKVPKIEPENEQYLYFLYVGRLSVEKGCCTLFEAWKEYSYYEQNVELIILGDGPLKEELESMVERESITRVHMKGQAPHDMVMKYMKNARAVIIPSICYEGLPVTLIEAYSCGCPVIGSDLGNIYDLIIPDETGLNFKVSDSHSLAAAMQRMTKEQRKILSCGARERYERCYTKEKNAEIINRIYEEVYHSKKI